MLATQLLSPHEWGALSESEKRALEDLIDAEIVTSEQLRTALKPKVAEFMAGVKSREKKAAR